MLPIPFGVVSSCRVLVGTLMGLVGLVYLHGSKCQECGKTGWA